MIAPFVPLFLQLVVAASAVAPDPGLGVPADRWLEGVQREFARAEYEFRSNGLDAFGAPNRAQGLRALVDERGLAIGPRDQSCGSWRLVLAPRGLGRAKVLDALEPARLSAAPARIELDRGGLREAWANDERGFGQALTILAPPAGAAAECVRVELAFEGELSARIGDDRRHALLVDGHGVPRARYHSLTARDARGEALDARLEPGAPGLALCIDDRNAVYPITVGATISGPAWTAEGNQAGAQFGWAAAPAGDVNGDGYSDVIVGAPQYDAGQSNEGRAFCYLGGPQGLGASPAWTAESDQAGAFFGWEVATAGDVNGDGYSDVIVSAVRHDAAHADEGRAFVYLGSALGLAGSAAWTADGGQAGAFFGECVATCGDVDGDGYSDVVVGAIGYDGPEVDEGRALVYLGGPGGPSAGPSWTTESDQAGAALGSSVAPAGDVDGDGFGDLLVGAMQYAGPEVDEGRAELFLGSSTGLAALPAWSVEGDQADAYLGRSLACAGDVDADGYADVVIGAYVYDGAEVDAGRAWVYLGGPAGLEPAAAWSVTGAQAVGRFGRCVAGAGDVNGDGYGDLLVGAHVHDGAIVDEGRAFLYLGSETGPSAQPAWTADGGQLDVRFGKVVACAGDVNGDGYADLLATAFLYSAGQSDEGRASVYFGAPGGLAPDPAWMHESDQALARFGRSSASAGDVNGDGFGDVLVSSYRYDAGEMDEGRVFAFHGSADGLSASPAWTAEGDQVGALFGYSVSSAGDVDGDGFGDIVIGAYAYDGPELDEGRAFVYLGSPSGLAATPAWIAQSDEPDAKLGISVAGAGDVDGDGFADVIVGAPGSSNGEASEGRAYAFHGGASGLRATPAWSAESDAGQAELGWSVARAGDVDGDGYSDVIVGAPGFDGDAAQEGRAFVFHGSPAGLAPVAGWTADGSQANARLGWSVASAGDVDGDGFADVVVGAPGATNGELSEGAAFVFPGGPGGLDASPSWSTESDQALAALGRTVAGVGDVNGDGFADVAVGSLQFDADELNEGRVWVHLGSSAGLASEPDWVRGSGQAGAEFGWSIAGAGDVDGDGDDELIVGAVFWDGGASDEGGAWLFEGNGGRGGWIRAPEQRRTDGATPVAPLGRSDARDAFELRVELAGRLAGVSFATPGTPEAFLEWELAPLSEPFDGEELGRSALGAPVDPFGPPIAFSELASPGGFAKGAWKWRARIAFAGSPLFARTPWFDLPGDARSESKLRFPAEPAFDDL